MRFHCAIAPLVVLLFCLGAATAQIEIIEQVGDKAIKCTRSGLRSDLNYCGVRPWDTYVFVGSISATREKAKPEILKHGGNGGYNLRKRRKPKKWLSLSIIPLKAVRVPVILRCRALAKAKPENLKHGGNGGRKSEETEEPK